MLSFLKSKVDESPARRRSLSSKIGLLALRLAVVIAAIAAITAIGSRLIPVNATTVGFAYLVAVLVIASAWGFIEATVASFVSVLCFDYFFIPPVSGERNPKNESSST